MKKHNGPALTRVGPFCIKQGKEQLRRMPANKNEQIADEKSSYTGRSGKFP